MRLELEPTKGAGRPAGRAVAGIVLALAVLLCPALTMAQAASPPDAKLRSLHDLLWLTEIADRRNLDAGLRRLLETLEKSKVPTASSAESAALEARLRAGGIQAEEGARTVGLLRLGVEVAGFAAAGDLVWVVRIEHQVRGVTQEFWVSSSSGAIRATLPRSAGSEGPRQSGAPVPFVDAHVHLNDESMQLELMGRYGAGRAVIFWGRHGDNETIAAAARRHPERFIAFASISPERAAYRKAWDAGDPGLLKTFEELLASGRFKGIGEISAVHFPSPGFGETDYDPAGPMMRGIMALARRYRMPVMVHVETTRLRELGLLLEAFPDVPVIWAHGGYTPLAVARRMLERHPNLHYELSARTWPRHPRSPEYTILRDGDQISPEWLALIEARADRFIIGTDASQRSREMEIMKHESVQNVLRQLSPPARERVAMRNLLRLLGETP
jgi:predicted TIM-barrel fold metal-dependent hydrolase